MRERRMARASVERGEGRENDKSEATKRKDTKRKRDRRETETDKSGKNRDTR